MNNVELAEVEGAPNGTQKSKPYATKSYCDPQEVAVLLMGLDG